MGPKKEKEAEVSPSVEEKQKKLQDLIEHLREEEKVEIANLNAQCKTVCDSIYKMYDDHLKAIPENLRNKTLKEIMELEQKKTESNEEELSVQQLKSDIEGHRIKCEKKKRVRVSRFKREQRKKGLIITRSSVKLQPGNLPKTFVPHTQVSSDSNLQASKEPAAPVFAVIPKFNPKVVVNKTLLRKPRAGEVIMSLSGSPLKNIFDDTAGKPGFAVSLRCGKVLNIMADKEFEKVEMNDDVKSTLELAKQKIEEILKSE
ncbi:uncharacterized protein LOC129231799 [Uloborus diversus]|uniref:uncharacterized protein LOC129231799 n=1 Tax=Uloborus diversus TaxID=327109 RepID=UPI00240A6941|nr:uncharacterized protein LOC129231799 [Uloborus diversus]